MLILGEILRRQARVRRQKTAYVVGARRAATRQVQKTLLRQQFQLRAAWK